MGITLLFKFHLYKAQHTSGHYEKRDYHAHCQCIQGKYQLTEHTEPLSFRGKALLRGYHVSRVGSDYDVFWFVVFGNSNCQ